MCSSNPSGIFGLNSSINILCSYCLQTRKFLCFLWKLNLAKTYDLKVGTWWIPLNQLSMPSRDMQKSPIAYTSKWNCNSPQWGASRLYGWGRVVKNPNHNFKNPVRSTQKIVEKICFLVSISPFSLWKEREKQVVKLLWGQGSSFPNTTMPINRDPHMNGHRFSCQVYLCPDSMNGCQEGNKQNHLQN